MKDDIVDLLRQGSSGCTCAAWNYHECGCTEAQWSEMYIDAAADEIERLRELADSLAQHLQGYVCHCNMSKCKCGYDDIMDEYKEVRGG